MLSCNSLYWLPTGIGWPGSLEGTGGFNPISERLSDSLKKDKKATVEKKTLYISLLFKGDPSADI